MLTLINLLIIFFILLIFYQLFLAYFENMIEGYTNNNKNKNNDTKYKDYDKNKPNNALILAQQNAGNIIVLKGQLDKMLGINKQVQDLSGNVASLQQQVSDLVQAQKEYASQMTGGKEPEISGTTE